MFALNGIVTRTHRGETVVDVDVIADHPMMQLYALQAGDTVKVGNDTFAFLDLGEPFKNRNQNRHVYVYVR